MSLQPLAFPTYPARPVNGGPLDQAPAKTGEWYYEPKYNGWRALVHVPTGAMFNRKGEPLSINGEFSKATKFLSRTINFTDFPEHEWLDCEALERRHGLGRGTLIILDFIPSPERGIYSAGTSLAMGAALRNKFRAPVTLPPDPPTYRQRHDSLQGYCADGLITYLSSDEDCQPDDVYLCPHVEDAGGSAEFIPKGQRQAIDHSCGINSALRKDDDPEVTPGGPFRLQLWQELQEANARLGCQFYEGVVAKRADSLYPLQLRSPDLEFPLWIKHRWAW